VTGAIGHTNKGNYMIETPIAHIGVRGTDHESWYFPSSASSDGTSTEAGLYNRVNVGLTYIQTSSGEVVVGPNQVGYAASALDQPHLLGAMPEFFNRSFQPRSARVGTGAPVAAQGGATQGGGSQPSSSGGAPTGSSGTLAGYTAPRGKEGVSFGQTAVNPAISTSSGATLVNKGEDTTLGVNWGTWQGGLVKVNGRATSGSVNFISSNNLTTAAQLAALPPQLVTATYTGSGSATGGPNNPVTGTASLSVGINLTTQTVTNYSVNATVGAQNWTGSGSGSFSQYMSSSGISIDGKCSGCVPGQGAPTSHGTATGAFLGSDAGGMMTSFGMKAANQSMSGTGLLARPLP
jgi:hypothetical protein